MDNQETMQAAIDNLGKDVDGLKTLLQAKDTTMEFLLAHLADTKNKLAATEQRMDDLLLGSIATFAMPEPPQGWLLCDGQEVSRQTYALLFAKIGTTFGEGDGEETFNLPDLRGVFVRGWDGERAFGSHQEDQVQGHTHKDGGHSHTGGTSSAGSHKHDGKSDTDGSHRHELPTAIAGEIKVTTYCFIANFFIYKGKLFCNITDSAGSHDHNLKINSAGSHSHNFTTATASASLGKPIALKNGKPRCGNETRPANVALLFCIKY